MHSIIVIIQKLPAVHCKPVITEVNNYMCIFVVAALQAHVATVNILACEIY